MFISKNTEILKWKDKVILANKKSGKWIRISSRAYEIILEIIAENEKIESLRNNFELEEDFYFVKKLYETMMEMELNSHARLACYTMNKTGVASGSFS